MRASLVSRALSDRRIQWYPPSVLLPLSIFLVAYAMSFLVWSRPTWPPTGPASPDQGETLTVPSDALSNRAAKQATSYYNDAEYDQKAIYAAVHDHGYWVVYTFDARTTNVFDAKVLDGVTGKEVNDGPTIKDLGAWPYVGYVKRPSDWLAGAAAGLATIFLVYRFQRRAARAKLLGPNPNLSPRRRKFASIAYWTALSFIGFVLLIVDIISLDHQDPAEYAVFSLCTLAFLVPLIVYGKVRGEQPGWFLAPSERPVGSVAVSKETPTLAQTASIGAPPGQARASADASTAQADFTVEPPAALPTFRDVGGMEPVKDELHDTIGTLLAFPDLASKFAVVWNGLLLYGPPGTGKSYLARAAAGEFGLNFISVGSAELVGAYRGESARLIEKAFATARENLPCLLFFDEFDSIALRRDDLPNPEVRVTVNQILRSIEEYRKFRDLIVVAATNDLDKLDDAVVRPGRFDRHIRLDYPDRPARRAIIAAQLAGRPVATDLDLDQIALVTEGLSAAGIATVVREAAIAVMRDAITDPAGVAIKTADLIDAFKDRGGKDRPLAQEWGWDDLVLPAATKTELRQFQRLVEDPTTGERLGIQVPTGLLLYGPPGTGKTTVARVLAAQARASFYPISASEIESKWVGESEHNTARLFVRARENRPSIIFIDEAESLFHRRSDGGLSWGDRLVNQFLQEIDGINSRSGVFVVAATNRRDLIDPAMLRGGRLSRQIEIPLPGRDERYELLLRQSARMPLLGVDLRALADVTEGYAGADLKALLEQAALISLTRSDAAWEPVSSVTHRDVAGALDALARQRAAD
ncbi:MAG TPA: AAA family ATPase [Chloroflexota bacterium]|nr:AAA family ATPase [Chloroflexota bacterium]